MKIQLVNDEYFISDRQKRFLNGGKVRPARDELLEEVMDFLHYSKEFVYKTHQEYGTIGDYVGLDDIAERNGITVEKLKAYCNWKKPGMFPCEYQVHLERGRF